MKLRSGIDLAGLNLNLVAVNDELSAQAEWFPLQGQVDEVQTCCSLLPWVAELEAVLQTERQRFWQGAYPEVCVRVRSEREESP